MSKADFKLISVPPSTPIIRSEHGKLLDKVSEPVQEGSTLTLICETQGGEPLPRLTWKRGQSVLGTIHKLQIKFLFDTVWYIRSCLKVSTAPLRQWGFLQC